MNVRRPSLAALIAILAALVVMGAMAGPASASVTHELLGTFGLNGSGSAFPNTGGLAVDESTGSVYVFDAELGGLFKYTADGTPAQFSSLKNDAIYGLGGEFGSSEVAVDNSSGPAKGDIYVANRFRILIFSSTGESLGELSGKGNPYSGEQCGVSVSPSGDLYVTEAGVGVNRYVPTGNPAKNSDYVSTLFIKKGICHTSVDSAGNLYTSENEAPLIKYGAFEFNTLGQEAVGTEVSGPTRESAVDTSSNDLYADSGFQLYQYDQTGSPISTVEGFERSWGVAVNGSTGKVYVAEREGPVHIYGKLVIKPDVSANGATEIEPTAATLTGAVNPSGKPITKCVFEYGEVNEGVPTYASSAPCSPPPGSGTSEVAVSVHLTGLRESAQYDYRIEVANAEDENVSGPVTFETLGPPTSSVAYGAGNITHTEATLTGSVYPHGYETTFHFEYGKTASYGTNLPVPDINAGSGTARVSAGPVALTGLEPGTTYHFRIRATNSHGETFSADETFTTQPPAVISKESALNVRATTGTLRAEINPLSTDTTYRFEYGTSTGYGANVPAPNAKVNAAYGEQLVPVSAQVGSLQPGTTYHFRVVASNVYGTVTGPDHTFTTFEEPSGAVGADTCPNAAYRVRYSTSLPDCRAFEMVSPVDKSGADVIAINTENFVISRSGDRVDYLTQTGMGETHGSGQAGLSQFQAVRGADGWASHGVYPTPALNEPTQFGIKGTELQAFDEELETAVVETYSLPGVTGAVPNSINLYTEDMSTLGIGEALSKPEAPEVEGAQQMYVQGYASNLSTVTFETPMNLVPGASGHELKYYASRSGKIELIGYLPDGSMSPAGAAAPRAKVAGRESLLRRDTVSRDGTRIPFVSPTTGSESQLYLQRYGMASAWVSEPETAGPKFIPHNIAFQTMTPDGKHVLFTSAEPLTSSAVGSEGTGLYMYTDGPNPESEANLTFIGLVGPSSEQVVYGVSDDGSHVYFWSPSGLDLWDEGQIHFVAGNIGGTYNAWSTASADGGQFVFTTPQQVTSREIELHEYGQKDTTEIYLYDETSDKVTCVSCPPSGATPTSGVELIPDGAFYGAFKPFLTAVTRNVAWEGGYIFFSTSESLVPQDTNGIADAYEYDITTGKLSLLSPGTGENGSWFVQTNPSGSDALIATREQLTGWDEDKLDDVYDARVDGGFPEPPHPHTPCEGDVCQGVPAAVPSFNTASGFTGLGNIPPASNSSDKTKVLSKAQRLEQALKSCAKKPKRKRASCRARARKRFAEKSAVKRGSHRAGQ